MKPFLVKNPKKLTRNVTRKPRKLSDEIVEEIKKEIAVRTIDYKVVEMYGQKVVVRVLEPWRRLEMVLPEPQATVEGIAVNVDSCA